ncbi:eukaryotic translation initiation factor 4 gamma 3 isoform X4 [Pangasianodon hypophthalmus]|uniref:eukaryotic translation initiation factor 4 gamma 3 isoform X4 n=1 Tax=Pangasianodon hypophthalmus TaxID=310915 RepID=UPI000F004F75|nr:eukaryotic translation initiation factor 4 gamma 3 isoform X4 [Pangasianodon hypophthalmus]
MSLPQKAVPKSAAPAVAGPGPGPANSSQLRTPLATVPLPGPPLAQQPPPVPPTQVFLNALHPRIPRVQPPLDERIFSTQPGVAAVYSVQRPPGPPYTAHEISKGHPNLAATPPGHASSPGLSQVSVSTVSTAHLYGHPKAWEAGGGSPYTAGQNAGTAPLVYSPQTQPMNVPPQSRPFAPGPRPTHHQGGFRPIQFFQRTQMQPPRPTIPSNSPSIRPASQAPNATVYSPSPPIMMSMTPMPFASPQAAQYYIPQYRHSAPPYVGPPQQYSVQPTGPSTFYPGPTPGEFPPAYPAGTPYYPGQTMYPPSPSIIVPTPQQPPPAKREKKTIRIRDPNQGGKDITEEIMSGVGGSRNPTPPVGRPSSTPTPPQQLNQVVEHGHVIYNVDSAQVLPAPVDLKPDDKPKLESAVLKSSSPGLRAVEPPVQRREPSSPAPDPHPPEKSELPPSDPEVAQSVVPASVPSLSPSKPISAVDTAEKPTPPAEPSPAQAVTPEPDKPEPEQVLPEVPASAAQAVKAVNGLAETDTAPPHDDSDFLPLSQSSTEPSTIVETYSLDVKAASPPALEIVSSGTMTPSLPTTIAAAAAAVSAVPAPPPGLTHPGQAPVEAGPAQTASTGPELRDAEKEVEVALEEKVEPTLQSNLRQSSSQVTSSVPKTWKKPKEDALVEQAQCPDKEDKPEPTVEATVENSSLSSVAVEHRASAETPVEENGEQEAEPLKNGPEHSSEAESSDGVLTPALEEPNSNTIQKPELKNGKRQYNRDFLLGFQFMPACVQKPEGLPPISDVVLDKINQNKLPLRPDPRGLISRGPDFTPAFADFSRLIPAGRGAPLLNVGLRRPPPRKIIMNVSVNDEVQLKKAENAWKPGMKRENTTEDPETQKTQELFRKVRSILNKLTPQMFSQLLKQVTDLTIDTEERLKGVIDLVFEKAIDEPSFSVAYGNMCSCLATLKVPMADKPTSTVNFRKLLLNRCQKEFEKDKANDDVFEKKQRELEAAASTSERERLQEELEEAKDKARRRSIGNIKFIGELFKLRMLTEAIMHDCVVKLLKNHDEESLECLCRLLTTIGKDLDFEKAKPRMDQYFNQMEKIVKERKTSSRIRFMLQDVIDLRLHNWVSRRADLGPKTIEQIHKEAKIEEQEEQRKVHQQLLSKDKRRPVIPREETWNTVPVPKNSRTIDPNKIPKITKSTIDDKIQLGPLGRAQLNWMKGSSGGAGAKASESDILRPSSLNRYSPLQPSVSASASTPSASPDIDSRGGLSRGSSGRERSDKPLTLGPSRSGPLSLGGPGKEAAEEPLQEEVHKDTHIPDTPKLQPSAASRSKLERSQSRESVKLEAVPGPTTDKPALSEEEMEKRSKSIIDEFLHINDYKEAMQCVEELEQATMLYVFVRVGVESTLERSQITRDHMGQLFHQLLQAGSLSKSQFFKGFSETLEIADDMAIDIPHIWLYLAELVNPVLREGGISMRELFSEFSKPLLPVGRAGILFSEILHLLCKQMSHRKVGALWRDSGLSWADFLPETEDVHSFISEQKLDFTLSDCSSPPDMASTRTLSPEELNKQLEKLLLEDVASDEQIFDWVEANLDESEMSSPPFLRALMTAVCKAAVKWESSSCRVDTAIIQKRLPVLHKYLNSDTERQLQALYALQALIVKLDQPPNLLRMFFDCLYDEDVISEDAFYKWEASKDPAEQQGKGVALKSVTAFFTWLREAEEESEDN